MVTLDHVLQGRETVVLNVVRLYAQQPACFPRMWSQDPVVACARSSLRDEIQGIRVDDEGLAGIQYGVERFARPFRPAEARTDGNDVCPLDGLFKLPLMHQRQTNQFRPAS